MTSNSDYPRILTVGPTFEISVLAKATLDTSIELKSDLSFTTKGTKIVFPPRDDNLIQGVKPGASSVCFFFCLESFLLIGNHT